MPILNIALLGIVSIVGQFRSGYSYQLQTYLLPTLKPWKELAYGPETPILSQPRHPGDAQSNCLSVSKIGGGAALPLPTSCFFLEVRKDLVSRLVVGFVGLNPQVVADTK